MRSEQSRLRIHIAQLNPVVGDIDGNVERAQIAFDQAVADHADLVVFSELFICGYPPEDLVLRPALQDACHKGLQTLAHYTLGKTTAMLIGAPIVQNTHLYNGVALLENGIIAHTRFKSDLPNYGVFDEKRVFTAAPFQEPIVFKGLRIGVPICEDIWKPDIVGHLAQQNIDMLIVINGSPYWRGKHVERTQHILQRAQQVDVPLIYVNQVGAQDELVFDGASCVVHPDGHVMVQMPAFRSDQTAIDFETTRSKWRCITHHHAPMLDDDAADYTACVLGLRDYVRKNNFKDVILGLSGGIDSALCAAIAVDALGSEHVQTLMLPYRYTAQESKEDAQQCAKALGIAYSVVPIETAVKGLETSITSFLGSSPSGLTAENLQSRARGTILMSVSNTTGAMVVTTGNKSEMAVGYATLYGDMNGGFNPIKDLYKMQVYALSALRNRWKPFDALGADGVVIPERILTKAPTAELRENQTDQDSLPPYPVLDGILQGLVEHEKNIQTLIDEGFDQATVARIARLLKIAEYKRRQSAIGVKISSKSFDRDRRYPITNGFKERV